MSASKPTLHHLNNSQSQRVLWLLEELQIDYDVVHHFRSPLLAPEGLKKIHPLGKSPVLVTANGTVISESIAIITYLLVTYDNSPTPKFNFNPRSLPDEAAVEKYIKDEELVSFAGTTMGVFMMELIFEIVRNQTPWLLRWMPSLLVSGIRNGFTGKARKSQLAYLQQELGDNEWFSGAATPGRADFVLSFPLDVCAHRQWVDFKKDYPKLAAWRERVLERDGWKRAMTKGNGYNLNAF